MADKQDSHSGLSRREVLKYGVYGGLAARLSSGLWLSGCCGKEGTGKRPNIVIFLIDTLRSDRLGVYGYPKPTSPNIDSLAAESVVFEQCNAPAPWTPPSITSLLTSTFPCEHQVLIDGQKLDPAAEPLAVRLKKIDYATGSFYANTFAGPLTGLDRGYDICRSQWAVTGEIVEQWLRVASGKPFYLYVHNMEPHDPHETQLRFVKMFGDKESWEARGLVKKLYLQHKNLARVDFMTNRPLGTTDNTAKQQEAMRRIEGIKNHIDVLYDGAVRESDEHLGSVVDVLKRRGLWDDTFFIVIADHGEEMGDHGGWQHDHSVYEELIRVPMIIHFPGGQYVGQRVKDVVSLVDLMPTIFDYIQQPELTTGLRGNSFMPYVKGIAQRDPEELVVTSMRINKKKYYRPYKESRGDVNVVVRQGQWKGIFNAEPDSMELYNLDRDPFEKANLNEAYAPRAAAMRQHAKGWLGNCYENAMEASKGGVKVMDKETRRQLRSLGYID